MILVSLIKFLKKKKATEPNECTGQLESSQEQVSSVILAAHS